MFNAWIIPWEVALRSHRRGIRDVALFICLLVRGEEAGQGEWRRKDPQGDLGISIGLCRPQA